MNKEKTIREEVRVLLEKGFFDLKSGQVIIDKHNGVIQGMTFVTKPYKRKKDLTRKVKRL